MLCAPRCRGNYGTGPKVILFSFPKYANLRWKWLSAIHRDNFQPTEHTKMSAMTFLLSVLGVTALSEGRSVVFENRRRDTVWVGTLGSAERGTLKGGGWEMRPGSLVTIDMDDGWTGRFWGRTGCLFDGYGHGRCQTGDCGRRLQCNGTSGQPPVTFAEVNLGGWGSQDFYSISLVDGFNIPITIEPIDKQGGGDRYRCYPASCPTDINALCPSKLRSDGGCKSACLAFNTDQYCCRGRFSSAQACRSSSWPRNYPAFFKGLCPDAYSYPYDDDRSTFTCEKKPTGSSLVEPLLGTCDSLSFNNPGF